MIYSSQIGTSDFAMAEDPSISASPAIKVAVPNTPLALALAESLFATLPDVQFLLKPVCPTSDKMEIIPVSDNLAASLFQTRSAIALMNGEVDLAVHTALDLQFPLPQGLELIALSQSFENSDCLVSKGDLSLTHLPLCPKIGISPFQQRECLLKIRPDIQFATIDPTTQDSILLMEDGIMDGVILPLFALKHWGLTHRIAQVLPIEPHPLQGRLAIVSKIGNGRLKQIFRQIDFRQKIGKVTLVGFGPGDPGLLTIKGRDALAEADVIYMDDLIDKEYVRQFKGQKYYVGKRKNNHSTSQQRINRLLLNSAYSGNNVVRLKGGDPMIFAHGGEEVEYLQKNLVDVEVVPGITSALAAAATTKTPLTHRDITSSVTFVSGHSVEKICFEGNSTIVVYMGASNVQAIALKAIEQGRKPETGALLISNISLPCQEHIIISLQDLAKTQLPFKTPLLMIIGEVVGKKMDYASLAVRDLGFHLQ